MAKISKSEKIKDLRKTMTRAEKKMGTLNCKGFTIADALQQQDKIWWKAYKQLEKLGYYEVAND